ncbi:hypothetical protein MMC21_003604 [Puttea exsequens]|nr:hypothetical protein [Puttea exsequens]
MGRPKRQLLATVEKTSLPPTVLPVDHVIARVVKAEGNNLYSVELPSGKPPLLVELPSRFRSQIWIKRGGYVVIDMAAFEERENKLNGEIVNVVRDEKQWRKQVYWPPQFEKRVAYLDQSEDEDSTVGKMPPSEESESED